MTERPSPVPRLRPYVGLPVASQNSAIGPLAEATSVALSVMRLNYVIHVSGRHRRFFILFFASHTRFAAVVGDAAAAAVGARTRIRNMS